MLFLRALLAFLALPGIVAFLAPVLLTPSEPWLARTFPQEWLAYKSRVPRWLVGGSKDPRLRNP